MNDICGIGGRRTSDVAEVGGSAANLRGLTAASRPVPPGLVLHQRRFMHGAGAFLSELSMPVMRRGER
jgi:hypothetical protein